MYHRCLCCKVDWSSSLFIPRRVASFGLFAFTLLVVWEERVLVRPCDNTELTRGRRGHQRERGLKIILFPVIVRNIFVITPSRSEWKVCINIEGTKNWHEKCGCVGEKIKKCFVMFSRPLHNLKFGQFTSL